MWTIPAAGHLRAFIGRRVKNQADVNDLVQRVPLQIVTRLDTLRDAERLHAWATARPGTSSSITTALRAASARAPPGQQLRAVLEACCRIDLDRRGGVSAYTARHPDVCGCSGFDEEVNSPATR